MPPPALRTPAFLVGQASRGEVATFFSSSFGIVDIQQFTHNDLIELNGPTQKVIYIPSERSSIKNYTFSPKSIKAFPYNHV